MWWKCLWFCISWKQYQPMTHNKRPNPNSKHVCLLIAKTESHQRKKNQNNSGLKETRKRQREQKIRQRWLACLGLAVPHKHRSCCRRPRSPGRGKAGSSCLRGVPLAAPHLPGHSGELPGAGYLGALLSAAVVVVAGNFTGRGSL